MGMRRGDLPAVPTGLVEAVIALLSGPPERWRATIYHDGRRVWSGETRSRREALLLTSRRLLIPHALSEDDEDGGPEEDPARRGEEPLE